MQYEDRNDRLGVGVKVRRRIRLFPGGAEAAGRH